MERTFWAAHAVTVAGRPEPLHRHNWQVRLVVAGERLDSDGLLVDFEDVGRRLEAVLAGLADRDLNRTPPFDSASPTAERVARHIAEILALPGDVKLQSVSVTESPGCVATYRP